MKKVVIIDTNILLDDPRAFLAFKKNDIVIPYKVIEELEKHKTSQGEVGMNARDCSRLIAGILKEQTTATLKTGVKLDTGAKLFVISSAEFKDQFSPLETGDDHILAVCVGIKKEWITYSPILVSNDMLLRIRANSHGLKCETYDTNTVIKSAEDLYSGYKIIESSEDIIARYWEENKGSTFGNTPKEVTKEKLVLNDFIILSDGGNDLKKKPYPILRVKEHNKKKELCFVHEHKFNNKIKCQNIEQVMAVDLLMDPSVKLVSLTGISGCGKAQPLTSKILTPNGWKLMGEIKIGDLVIARNGKPTKVLGVFPQGKKNIYGITLSDGSYTESCDEHLWETKTIYDRANNRKGTVKSLKEIQKTLKIKTKRNHSIPMVESIMFNEKQTSIDPYVLGVLLGDGCLTQTNISLSSSDSEIIAQVINKVEPIGIELKQKSKYDWIFKNKKRTNKKTSILQSIIELGLNKKSSEKFIPQNYLFNNHETRLNILRGLMDTDGFVSKNGYGTCFYSTSSQLAKDVQFLVQSFGGKAVICDKQTSYTYKNIKKLGQKSYVVQISLPENIRPFTILRKLLRWKPRTKYQPSRLIENIKFIGEKEAQCIMVEDSEHLYITDDFIVTHNTLLAIATGLEQILEKKQYKQLVVLRPMHSVGKEIGFLPGTKEEKLDPWIAPIKDNLKYLYGKENVDYMLNNGTIEIEAITYIRGRSIPNSFIIVDEAQNIDPHELKAILTRAGQGTKIVLTGDIEQTDRKDVDSISNGLSVAIEKFKEYGLAGHITMKEGCRSELASIAAKIL